MNDLPFAWHFCYFYIKLMKMETMTDYSNTQLVEEVSELCSLLRGLIERQQHLESDVSHWARDFERLDGRFFATNSVVVEDDREHARISSTSHPW